MVIFPKDMAGVFPPHRLQASAPISRDSVTDPSSTDCRDLRPSTIGGTLTGGYIPTSGFALPALTESLNLHGVPLGTSNRGLPTYWGTIPSSLVTLDLGGTGLYGTMPASLVPDLVLLETLDLSFCRLSGRIPRELVNLPNLSRLQLQVNQLQGGWEFELEGVVDGLSRSACSPGWVNVCGGPSAINCLPRPSVTDLRPVLH